MDLVQAFLRTAEDDLQAATLLQARALWGPACFHAQQAAEKAAKAWLHQHGLGPGKTHYLSPILLRRAARDGDRALAQVGEAIDVLEEYATEARYPVRLGQGGYQPPSLALTREDAEEALRLAQEILSFATHLTRRDAGTRAATDR